MNMIKKHESGFGIVEMLVVLVMIGLVGTVGWLVYDRQQSKSAAKDAPTNQKEQTNTDPTTPPSVTTGYYEIKEWGIKITLRDYDKIQFKVVNESGMTPHGDNSYEAYAEPTFKPEFLQDKTCKPGLSLYRTKTYFEGADDLATKVGDYYYFSDGAPGPCSSDPLNNPDDLLKGRFIKDMAKINIVAL